MSSSENIRPATPRPALLPWSACGPLSKHAMGVSGEVRAGQRGIGTPHPHWAGEESRRFVSDRTHRDKVHQSESCQHWPQRDGKEERSGHITTS